RRATSGRTGNWSTRRIRRKATCSARNGCSRKRPISIQDRRANTTRRSEEIGSSVRTDCERSERAAGGKELASSMDERHWLERAISPSVPWWVAVTCNLVAAASIIVLVIDPVVNLWLGIVLVAVAAIGLYGLAWFRK